MTSPTPVALDSTETVLRRNLREARDQFLSETARHEMTVLADRMDPACPTPGGPQPYRHLRFARPGTGIYRFDLVTWPGYLAITGDLADYTFRRLHDMVDFFRTGRRDGRVDRMGDPQLTINPGYWGEKLFAEPSGTDHGRVPYSQEVFVEEVRACMDDAREEYDPASFAQLSRSVDEELLDCPPEYAEEAYRCLHNFRWRGDDPSVEFDFGDVGEWDFRTYDLGFLIACYAVAHGVSRYLAEFPDRIIREV